MTETVGLRFTGDPRDAVNASKQVDQALEGVQRQARETATAIDRPRDALGRYSKASGDAREEAGRFRKETGAGADELGRFTRGAISGSGILGGFGRQLAFASGAFLGGAGLLALVRSLTDELSEGAAVASQTQAALTSTGGVAGVTAEHVDKLATSIEHYGAVDDEAVHSAENLLLTFTKIRNTKTDKIFDDATRAVVDMSRRMGGDLTGAAVQVGKALQDPLLGITALHRVGVDFSASTKELIKNLLKQGDVIGAQKIILHELNVEFGHSEEQYGKTMPGAFARLLNTSKDLAAEFLQGLVPSILTAVGVGQKQINQLGNTEEGHKKVAAAAQHVGDVLSTVVDTVKRFVTIANDAAGAAGGWKNTLVILGSAFVAWKTVSIASAIAVQVANLVAAGVVESAWRAALIATGWGAFAVAAGLAAQYAITHWEQVKDWFAAFWVTLQEGFNVVWEALKANAYQAALNIIEPFTHLPSQLGQWARDAKTQLEDGLGNIEASEQASVDRITEIWANGGKSAADAWAAGHKGLTAADVGDPGSRASLLNNAIKLGVGSGGVYATGGGHGGIAKPGTKLDCSGYIYQVFTQAGFEGFPGVSETQWTTASGGNWTSERIDMAAATVGDVVFMVGSPKYPSPGHVGFVYSGTGAQALVMEYRSPGEPPTGDRTLGQIGDIVGIKRFYFVKKEAGATTTPPPKVDTGGDATPPTYDFPIPKPKKPKAITGITDLTPGTALAIANAEALPDGVGQLNAEIDAYGMAIDELTKKLDKVKDEKLKAQLITAIGGFRKQITAAQQALGAALSDVPLDLQAKLQSAESLTGKRGIAAQMNAIADIVVKLRSRLKDASGKDLIALQAEIKTYVDKVADLTTQLIPPIDTAPKGTERTLLGRLQSILKQATSGQALAFSPGLAAALAAQTKKLIAQVTKAASDGLFTQAEADQVGKRADELSGRFQSALSLKPLLKTTRTDLQKLVDEFTRMPADVQAKTAGDFTAIQKTLGNVVSDKDVDTITARMAKITAAIEAQVQKARDAVTFQQGRLSDAFSGLLDKAYDVFDAQTQKLLDNVRVTVAGIGSIGATEKTPAELALADRQAAKDAADRQKRLDDINAQIAALSKQTDLERQAGESAEDYRRRVADAETQRQKDLADAQQQLQTELYDQETTRLEAQAQAERTAVDTAITAKQKEVEAVRAIEKQALQDQIDDELARWKAGEETASTAQSHILGILQSYGINYNAAGLELGTAFADGFHTALDTVSARIADLVAAQNELARETGTTPLPTGSTPAPGGGVHTPGPAGGYVQTAQGRYGSKPMFAYGGVVGGSYMGRDDTVAAWLTPGERVLTREQNAVFTQLAEALASGGLGGHTFIFQGHVWDKEQLVRDVRDGLSKLGGVTPGGIFGGRA